MPAEVFRLNLDRLLRTLGLRENLTRDIQDNIQMVIDVSQFLDAPIGVPGGPPGSPALLSPVLRVIAQAAVGPGVDLTVLTVPVGVRWRLRYFSAQLATSAVVGVRQPNLTVTTPLPTTLGFPAPFAQAAGQQIWWEWIHGGPAFDSGAIAAPGQRVFSLPLYDVIAFGGTTIATITAGLLAGDQWSLSGAIVEELPA